MNYNLGLLKGDANAMQASDWKANMERVRTISDALYDIIEERKRDGGNPLPLHDRMEYLLNRECLYEDKIFDAQQT